MQRETECLESPEQSSMGDRKGKLRSVTSSDKQCWAMVSCHTHQIHTGGAGWGWCRWEGERGRGGELCNMECPSAFLPVATG